MNSVNIEFSSKLVSILIVKSMGKKPVNSDGSGHSEFQLGAKKGGTSIAAYKRAAAHFRADGNEEGAAKVLISLGWMYEGQERYSDAIAYFDDALKIYEKLDNGEWAANCHWYKAKIHVDWGRFDDAVYEYGLAMEIDRALSLNQAFAEDIEGKGVSQAKAGNIMAAAETLENAAEAWRVLGHDGKHRDLIDDVVKLYRDAGDVDAAISVLQRAIDTTKESGAIDSQLHFQGRLGAFYHDQGNHGAAIEAYTALYDAAIGANVNPCIADASYMIGLSAHLLKDDEQALAPLEEALSCNEQIKNLAQRANILQTLGSVLRCLGRFDEAIDRFEQSIAVKEQLHDKSGVAWTLGSIARAHDEAGRVEAAIAARLKQAIIYESIHSQKELAATWMEAGRLYANMKQIEKASDAFDHAAETYAEIGDDRGAGAAKVAKEHL
jgi:tetratricopeptide (TPR) repeat protein